MQAAVQTNQVKEFQTFIEEESMKIIRELSKGDISDEKIGILAEHVLDTIKPASTLEELYQSAVKLDDNFPEFAPLVYKIMKEYEQKYEKRAIEQVSELIKQKKYDEAKSSVQKVLAFKSLTS